MDPVINGLQWHTKVVGDVISQVEPCLQGKLEHGSTTWGVVDGVAIVVVVISVVYEHSTPITYYELLLRQ